MQSYFNELMNEVQQQRCFSEYSQYELKIRVAYKKFLLYVEHQDDPDSDNYLTSFLQECNDSACTDAAFAIGQTLSGSTGLMGCDMMAILYEGIAGTELYFKGYQDMLMDKASYLLTLMNMGIIVTSGHDTLSAPAATQDTAYEVTQQLFSGLLPASKANILKYYHMCLDNWYENSQVNEQRLMFKLADAGASNEIVTQTLTSTINVIHSQYKWGSDCYSNISGFDNHTVIAENNTMTTWFHFANQYDAIVNVLPCGDACPPSVDVFSPYLAEKSNQKGKAEDIATWLWENLCLNGVHVVERYVDFWVEDELPENASSFTVGSHWSIYAWGDSSCLDIDRTSKGQHIFIQ